MARWSADQQGFRRRGHPRLPQDDLVAHPGPLRGALVTHASEHLHPRLAGAQREQPAPQVLGPRLERGVGRLDRVEEAQKLALSRLVVVGRQRRAGRGGALERRQGRPKLVRIALGGRSFVRAAMLSHLVETRQPGGRAPPRPSGRRCGQEPP